MSLKKFTLSLASLASLSLLVACSPKEQATSSTQASTSREVTTAQSAETTVYSSTASSVTNIDGTYKGQDEGDSITLVVTSVLVLA